MVGGDKALPAKGELVLVIGKLLLICLLWESGPVSYSDAPERAMSEANPLLLGEGLLDLGLGKGGGSGVLPPGDEVGGCAVGVLVTGDFNGVFLTVTGGFIERSVLLLNA